MAKKNLKVLFGKGEELDKKSMDFLTKALESNNLEGFDYIEFKQSLAALRDLNMDDATAVKSAFATASTLGLTKQKLVETAEFYKKVLEREKEQFDEALQKQLRQKVEAKREELKKLKDKVKKHREKIAQLESEIAGYEEKMTSADEIIENNRRKLEETNQNFEHTYTTILEQIDKDIENINKLI